MHVAAAAARVAALARPLDPIHAVESAAKGSRTDWQNGNVASPRPVFNCRLTPICIWPSGLWSSHR
jgi:hypothetical protein